MVSAGCKITLMPIKSESNAKNTYSCMLIPSNSAKKYMLAERCVILPPVEFQEALSKITQPDKILKGNLRWTSIASKGSRNTPSGFILQKPEIRAALMNLLAHPITIGEDFTLLIITENELYSLLNSLTKHCTDEPSGWLNYD